MQVEGVPTLVAKIQKARAGLLAATGTAVQIAGEDLLNRSLHVTPMDEGWLRQSGNVRRHVTPTSYAVTVGYDTPYALAVHEMPNDSTNWTTPGTGSKFLEAPFAENSARYAKAIMAAAEKGLWVGG